MTPTPVVAQRSNAGILQVTATLRDEGLLINISDIPTNAQIECDLDTQPLAPCHDGALFSRPIAGDHHVSVTALIDGKIAAVGDSGKFNVPALNSGALLPDDAPGSPLALVLDKTDFVHDMAITNGKDLNLPFKFLKKPNCDAIVRCRYDSLTSTFWTECNDDNTSYTVKKEWMPTGRQFFSVQAHCPESNGSSENFGPILSIAWYGVPEDYKPLMLYSVDDGHDRHIVNLVRLADCPLSQQVFECAATSSDDFKACPTENTLDRPTKGTRIRVACNGQKGPDLSIGL